MTNILIEFSDNNVTAKTTIDFFYKFKTYHRINVRAVESKKIKINDIIEADIIVSVRSFNAIQAAVAELSKKLGKFYVEVIDDNLFKLYRNDFFMKHRQKCLQKALDNSDIIWAYQPYLGKLMAGRSVNKRLLIIGSWFEKGEMNKPNYELYDKNTFKMVFYRSDGTLNIVKEVLVPMISGISSKINKKPELYLIGISDCNLNIAGVSVHYVDHMDYNSFKKYLRDGHFDLGLAPLADDPVFNSCKYFNKYWEYTRAGIPGIYSNVIPYTYVIENKTNGIICNNSNKEWVENISFLANNTAERHKIVENAQKWSIDNMGYERVMAKFIDQFPEVLNYKSAKIKASVADRLYLAFEKWFFMLFYICERVAVFFIVLRKSGLKYALQRVKRVVRHRR